jgi:hypothetical protein
MERVKESVEELDKSKKRGADAPAETDDHGEGEEGADEGTSDITNNLDETKSRLEV